MTLGFLPLVTIAVAAFTFGINIPTLTRDVSAVANVNPLVGALSTLGILVWSASAAIWLCTFIAARAKGDLAFEQLARWSALLSAWLAFDDGFQFHEWLAPNFLHMPERLVLAALLLAIFIYLVAFRVLFAHSAYRLKWSLALLGGSVAMDMLPEALITALGQWEFFLEDGLKWAGIVGWMAFSLGSFRRGLATG